MTDYLAIASAIGAKLDRQQKLLERGAAMFARIPLSRIEDNPFQTRSHYNTSPDLADSISQMAETRPETSGLIQVPLARVVLDGDGQNGRVLDPQEYGGALPCLEDEPQAMVQIAAGHRRLRAFRSLSQFDDQFATLPVNIAILDDEAMATVAWEENAKRDDLSPIEEAESIQRAIDELGWTQSQVGEKWGLTQAAVSNKLRLLKLPNPVKRLLRQGEITERHGRALLPLLELNVSDLKLVDILGQHDPGGIRSVAQVEAAVEEHLNQKTNRLSKAPWPADWLPGDGIKAPTCANCDKRIARNSRCPDLHCYRDKDRLYTVQVKGPAAANKLYNEHSGWEKAPSPASWFRCEACGLRHSDMANADGQWYRNRHRYICPSCWTRAQLPEITPEPSAPTELATAPLSPSPQGEGPGEGGTSTPQKLDMKPKAKPEPPPEPPPPPATLITARILPGAKLVARRVMVAIAEEGQPPASFESGLYPDLANLVAQACAKYFPGNGTSSPLPEGGGQGEGETAQ